MFIDEIYKQLLVDQKEKLSTAHMEVCRAKRGNGDPTLSVKQIENGYQLFRKRNPDRYYPEGSFRRYCFMRWSRGRTNIPNAKKAFAAVGWKIDPEWLEE